MAACWFASDFPSMSGDVLQVNGQIAYPPRPLQSDAVPIGV
jgi:hypothetical protein